jgi:hypothetical protein
MLVVDHAKRRLINNGQAQGPAYFRHRDFLEVQEEVPIQIAAGLEISAAEDKERSVGSINGLASSV